MLETTTANGRRLIASGFIARHGRRPAFSPALLGLLFLSVICGCGSGSRGMDEKALIRTGGSAVTVRAFREAFKSGVTSPSRLSRDPEALNAEKYRALNRLAEELLILERARELDLHVSEQETAQVVNDLKKDFPDDTFEKTLIENGISFPEWKKALQQRLLMEKVIRMDLSENAFRTPLTLTENREAGDMENPPENKAAHADGSEAARSPDNEKVAGVPGHAITAEAEYPDWINRLKQQYAIEIDWKLWEIIMQEQPDDA
jgi:hypothetical protein